MTEENINQKLAKIIKQVKAIGKNKENKQQGFKFRGIDDVMTEVHDLFAEEGILITQKILNTVREERPSKSGGILIWSIIDFEFSFYAPDGSHLETQMRGEGMDSGDKGSNKAVSIALKYAIIDLLTIPTEEQANIDPDKTSHELKGEVMDTNFAASLGDEHICPTCGDRMKLGKDGKTYYCVSCWKKSRGL